MAAPTYIGSSGEPSWSDTSTTKSPTIHASTLAGDLLVAGVMRRDDLSPPTGWNLRQSVDVTVSGVTQYLDVYTKVAEASDIGGTPSWTVDSAGDRFFVHIQTWRGDSGTPTVLGDDEATVLPANSTISIPGTLISDINGSVAIGFGASYAIATSGSVSVSVSTGWTRTAGASASTGVRLAAGYKPLAHYGNSSGNFVWSSTAGAGKSCIVLLIGNPADDLLLDKINAIAAYADTTAEDLIKLSRVNKVHTTAVYRNLNAGFINRLMTDKIHITAVYRLKSDPLPPQKRRIQNTVVGTWPFTLWGSPVLDAVKDEEYEGFQVTYKSGVAPVLFFLDGEWPVGIAMQPDGMVAGTPTEFGVFPDLSIIGIDGALHESILPVGTLTVLEYPPLEISGTPVLEAIQDTPYDGFTVAAVGGQAPRTFSLVGTWPTGITVHPTSGVVSGTPTEDGTFAGLSIRVDDSDDNFAELEEFSLEVASAPP